jgi:DnaJ-class molecular chaperone
VFAKNYYEILGAAPSASERELKERFRKLMKLYHPDIDQSPEAMRRYTEIMEAYGTLSDKSTREVYDLSHHFERASSMYGGSPPPSRAETMDPRREHYERLIREKRAREQVEKNRCFSPYDCLVRRHKKVALAVLAVSVLFYTLISRYF